MGERGYFAGMSLNKKIYFSMSLETLSSTSTLLRLIFWLKRVTGNMYMTQTLFSQILGSEGLLSDPPLIKYSVLYPYVRLVIVNYLIPAALHVDLFITLSSVT